MAQFTFLTPEEQDTLIKSRIAMHTTKGNNCKKVWTEDALMVRRQVIIDLLGQGLSYTRIQQELMARWGVGHSSVINYIKEAIRWMGEQNKAFTDDARDAMMERLTALAEDAIAHNDRKSALGAYEMMSRIQGITTDKKDINLTGSLEFKFGGE